MSNQNLRYIASLIINAVTDGQSLSEYLPHELAQLQEPRDRAFVQAICFGVCRYYTRLDVVLSHFLQKPMNAKDSDVHALLLVGLYQILFMKTAPHAAVSETVNAVAALKKPWARGFVNAILRECLRQQEHIAELVEEDDEAKYAHPEWWIRAIRKVWPLQFEEILAANNEHPPFSLRVNQQHGSVEDYLQRLQSKELAGHPIAGTAHGIILDQAVAVEELPGFADGDVTVQDGAAQLAAALLQLTPGLRVLDACAAPGGKLTHILEMEPSTTVVAIEKDKARLSPIQDNLRRAKQTAKCICADAGELQQWWDGKPFDRILLDAPCSASGVIRRHPDIKLLRVPNDIEAFAQEQSRLLTALWKALAPGGLLVYVTCSIFPQENTDVIQAFLSTQADATEEVLTVTWGLPCAVGRQILPGMDEMDGFYFACLRKALVSSI